MTKAVGRAMVPAVVATQAAERPVGAVSVGVVLAATRAAARAAEVMAEVKLVAEAVGLSLRARSQS